MSVWAITMVKDEADVIEAVLRHVAAQGVEGIIVADNGSTDGTREIIETLGDSDALDPLGDSDALDPVTLVLTPDDDPAYYQSAKMTRLADLAHASGARWVWPFDADELWYYGTESDRLADVIPRIAGDASILQSRLWHHFPTALDPIDDYEQEALSPFERMRYRGGDEAPIGKVIVRWQPGAIIHQGNHGATIPGLGPTDGILHTDIQVRHFPYRSPEQFVSKAINGSAAYAATDLDWSVGQHWREYGLHYEQGGPERLRRIFYEHFFYDLPSAAGLVYDPARLDS